MDLLQKIELFIGEGESDGKSFPTKKKKDDKSSEEVAVDAEKKLKDMETDDEDGEDPYDPETDLDKKKKQKELKKKAMKMDDFTPPYAAS